jgi:ketosteroid isomerase-like protein
MKKFSVAFMTFVFFMTCSLLVAQQPARRGHMHHPMTPPATGAMLQIANELVEAINQQDGAKLQEMLAPDAVYLDEDGHAPPARAWIHKIATGTPPKHITLSSTHSQMWGDAGWVSFNYNLTESLHGQPKTLEGTASIVVRKMADGEWKIVLVHGALKQTVAGITQ